MDRQIDRFNLSWVVEWVGGWWSRVKDCLPQLKIQGTLLSLNVLFFANISKVHKVMFVKLSQSKKNLYHSFSLFKIKKSS